MATRPLFHVFPRLESQLPVAELAELPTALEALPGAPEVLVKRDDLTSPIYGGNKVRTLEVLFGAARAAGASHVYATGGYGSNHAVATVLHAGRVGLRSGIVLFPQPENPTALENLRVSLALAHHRVLLPHWSALPFGMHVARRAHRGSGEQVIVMGPGGASPLGALGYVSAAFELVEQLAAMHDEPPAEIVLPVGSTCTTAGLVLGLYYAARFGLGPPRPPRVRAVRVAPWPVTAARRILGLSVRTSELLAARVKDPSLAVSHAKLAPGLTVDRHHLGRGYGDFTDEAIEASARLFGQLHTNLDPIYMGKAAAAAFAPGRPRRGRVVLWLTKSSAPLPSVQLPDALPPSVVRWIERAARGPSPLPSHR